MSLQTSLHTLRSLGVGSGGEGVVCATYAKEFVSVWAN